MKNKDDGKPFLVVDPGKMNFVDYATHLEKMGNYYTSWGEYFCNAESLHDDGVILEVDTNRIKSDIVKLKAEIEKLEGWLK